MLCSTCASVTILVSAVPLTEGNGRHRGGIPTRLTGVPVPVVVPVRDVSHSARSTDRALISEVVQTGHSDDKGQDQNV